jgi:hypothetical protein
VIVFEIPAFIFDDCRILVTKRIGKNILGNLGLGTMLLQIIFNKLGIREWSGFIWYRIGATGNII